MIRPWALSFLPRGRKPADSFQPDVTQEISRPPSSILKDSLRLGEEMFPPYKATFVYYPPTPVCLSREGGTRRSLSPSRPLALSPSRPLALFPLLPSRLLACLPSCLLALSPACLLSCLPSCSLALLPAGPLALWPSVLLTHPACLPSSMFGRVVCQEEGIAKGGDPTVIPVSVKKALLRRRIPLGNLAWKTQGLESSFCR